MRPTDLQFRPLREITPDAGDPTVITKEGS